MSLCNETIMVRNATLVNASDQETKFTRFQKAMIILRRLCQKPKDDETS